MSHTTLFRQIALSAAVAASGGANAFTPASIPTPVILNGGKVVQVQKDTPATAASAMPNDNKEVAWGNLAPQQTALYAHPAVKELEQRALDESQIPLIRKCYEELSVADKPLAKMNPVDATVTVNCVDQKRLSEFVKDPITHEADTVSLLRSRYGKASIVANEMGQDKQFGRKIADTCLSRETPNISDFNTCAENIVKVDNQKARGITAAISFGLAIILIGGMGLCRPKFSSREPS